MTKVTGWDASAISDFVIRICFVIRHSNFVIWSSSLNFARSLPMC